MNSGRKMDFEKVDKPLKERRRRARINQALHRLKSMVLQSMNTEKAPVSKLEKADILEMTINYIQQLQAALTTTSVPGNCGYTSGFNQCTAFIVDYLSAGVCSPEAEGEISNAIRQHLASVSPNSDVNNSKEPTSGKGALQKEAERSTSEERNVVPSTWSCMFSGDKSAGTLSMAKELPTDEGNTQEFCENARSEETPILLEYNCSDQDFIVPNIKGTQPGQNWKYEQTGNNNFLPCPQELYINEEKKAEQFIDKGLEQDINSIKDSELKSLKEHSYILAESQFTTNQSLLLTATSEGQGRSKENLVGNVCSDYELILDPTYTCGTSSNFSRSNIHRIESEPGARTVPKKRKALRVITSQNSTANNLQRRKDDSSSPSKPLKKRTGHTMTGTQEDSENVGTISVTGTVVPFVNYGYNCHGSFTCGSAVRQNGTTFGHYQSNNSFARIDNMQRFEALGGANRNHVGPSPHSQQNFESNNSQMCAATSYLPENDSDERDVSSHYLGHDCQRIGENILQQWWEKPDFKQLGNQGVWRPW